MVSTYMMNLFKEARDNGIFNQYTEAQVTKDPKQRSGAISAGNDQKDRNSIPTPPEAPEGNQGSE